MTVSIVIPTIGRPSLDALLDSLARQAGPPTEAVIVVDDRAGGTAPLRVQARGWLDGRVRLVRTEGRGPAAARNAGWRAADTEWVAFLDDDVVVEDTWLARLAEDLAAAGADVAGVHGRIVVPLPQHRPPTDWERNTAGLATARWITADMAYRRAALDELDGFDDRLPRAYREDSDLALRVMSRGYRLVRGERVTVHPVRPADWLVSVRQQVGNFDDALMDRLHGKGWRERAGAPRGRIGTHAFTVGAALASAALAVSGRQRMAAAAAVNGLAATARFAWTRIAPGPRDPIEVVRMISTSVLIPPVAVAYRIAGRIRHRNQQPRSPYAAVLFDRDGTLVHDVPYNGNPELVRPVRGARRALDRLRAAGVAVGVVTNQSGIARGTITAAELDAVHVRIEQLLGQFDVWQVCPHGPHDGCHCRKPRPGLILEAAAALGLPPGRCAVVGDIGADVEAAHAAGAFGVLVPNGATRPAEIQAAPVVCTALSGAVDAVLTGGLA